MLKFKRHYRQIFRCNLIALTLIFPLLYSGEAFAASQDSTVFFRIHCEHLIENGDTIFGPVPDVEGMVGITDGTCPRFEVEDPQTLKTIPLGIGDTLEFDVAVYNPSRQPLNHVRSWISYDINILEGVSIDITPNFPLVTPGESDFDHINGNIMIEASNEEQGANAFGVVAVAHVKLRVKSTPPSGTHISFYDIQPGGHTAINTKENGNDVYVLGDEPGGLHVIFAQNTPPPNDQQAPPQENNPPPDGQQPPPQGNNPPQEEFFGENNPPPINQPPPPPPVNSPQPENGDTPADVSEQPSERTAFALLQVRNLRVTSDGTSVFLAWDELNSSSLQAYNIYYGY